MDAIDVITTYRSHSAAGGFLDVIYISWMLLAGYSRYAISTFFYAVAGAGAAAAFGFCVFLRCTHGYGRHVIAAIALCTFPPTAIGSLAAFSSQAPTHVDLYADLHRGASTDSDLLRDLLYRSSARRPCPSCSGWPWCSRQSRGWRPLSFACSRCRRGGSTSRTRRGVRPPSESLLACPPVSSPLSPAQAHAAFVLHMLEAISPFLLMGLAALADVDISLADNYAHVYARSQVTQTSFGLA